MSPTRFSYAISLGTGTHAIRLEMFENTGTAVAKLSWTRLTSERPIGNIITCVPPQKGAWIKVYRLDSGGEWVDMAPQGIGSICSTGYLKIDGLPVDRWYGGSGQPYWVEQWIDNTLVRSVGNTQRGEPEFRVYPAMDNYTPWSCPPP